MAKSLRSTDIAVESTLAGFLDEHFYPRYVTNFHRYTDRYSQLLGLDVHFDIDGREKLLVDEKAQAHYINKDLPTFAFEVSFVNAGGILSEGWLLDDTKQTQAYALMWIEARTDKVTRPGDITGVEVLLVDRRKLLVLLAGHRMDRHRAQLTAARIRLEGVGGKHEEGERPFWFVYSPQLAERPVNIVVRKEVLVGLAEGQWFVFP